jgi:hypothetical protein
VASGPVRVRAYSSTAAASADSTCRSSGLGKFASTSKTSVVAAFRQSQTDFGGRQKCVFMR